MQCTVHFGILSITENHYLWCWLPEEISLLTTWPWAERGSCSAQGLLFYLFFSLLSASRPKLPVGQMSNHATYDVYSLKAVMENVTDIVFFIVCKSVGFDENICKKIYYVSHGITCSFHLRYVTNTLTIMLTLHFACPLLIVQTN